jgi:hypothetical protein
MKRLFFSQGMLDSMVEAGKIKVDRGVLIMLAGDNPTFTLHPAVRIVRTIDNGADLNGLVGQIRSEAELRELGAETYMDSVIYKDIAHQADTGYIAEKQVPVQETEARTAPKPAQQPAEVAELPADKSQDANDLSKFILDNLL